MKFLKNLFGRGKSPPADDDGDMVSLVVLSDEHIALTLDSLREKLDQVYPGWFLPPREEGTFIVDGAVPGATYLIQSGIPEARGTFMLHNIAGPYTEFSNFADFIDDDALRQRALRQTCWLSVDLIRAHTNEADAYRFIGKVLAHLAPATAAVLVLPTRPLAIAFDDSVRQQLTSDGSAFGLA